MMLPRSSALRSNTLSPGIVPPNCWPPVTGRSGVGYPEFDREGGMEFGLFTEFPSPPGVTDAAAFDEALAQMKAAEDFGFDAVWLAEIHFQKDRSVLAAPLVPLSHPLRLAEDVATVDHIAKGRLEFGVGRSGLPGHYQGFNIPYSESRDRFVETLEILRKAWTQERFSHDGKYFQFNDVCIMPKPYQKPHRPFASLHRRRKPTRWW